MRRELALRPVYEFFDFMIHYYQTGRTMEGGFVTYDLFSTIILNNKDVGSFDSIFSGIRALAPLQAALKLQVDDSHLRSPRELNLPNEEISRIS